MIKMFPVIVFFSLLSFLSCTAIQEALDKPQGSKSSQASTSPASASPSTKYGTREDYLTQLKKVGQVESWAYQKLLYQAVERRDVEGIKNYVSNGANPNRGKKSEDNISVLCKAISIGCYECIEALAPMSDFNFGYNSAAGLPIVSAAKHSESMLNFLFDNYNIDPNASSYKSYDKFFAFNYIINLKDYYITPNKKKAAIKLLLEKGADPMISPSKAWWSYMYNIEEATVDLVQEFIQHGAAVDMMMNGYGKTTILGYAIEKKRNDIANVLLEKGANPNYCNTQSNTAYAPLYWAIKYNDLNMVKNLVAHGANIDNHKFYRCKPASTNTALNYAIKEGKDQAIIDFLVSNGAK